MAKYYVEEDYFGVTDMRTVVCVCDCLGSAQTIVEALVRYRGKRPFAYRIRPDKDALKDAYEEARELEEMTGEDWDYMSNFDWVFCGDDKGGKGDDPDEIDPQDIIEHMPITTI